MKKKRVIYSVLLVVLIGFVFFIYNSFNGNPLSKYLAQRELNTYLKETYPDQAFHISDGFYNFKFGEYSFDARQIGTDEAGTEYEFTLRGFLKPTVFWDGIYYSNLDEPLMEKLQNEAANEITELLADKLDVIANVSVQIEVLQGTYDQDVRWSKDLKIEKPLRLHMFLDSTNATREDVLIAAEIIQATLNEANYDYDHVTINGNIMDKKVTEKDDFGYVKYVVSFHKDTHLKLKDVRVEK